MYKNSDDAVLGRQSAANDEENAMRAEAMRK